MLAAAALLRGRRRLGRDDRAPEADWGRAGGGTRAA